MGTTRTLRRHPIRADSTHHHRTRTPSSRRDAGRNTRRHRTRSHTHQPTTRRRSVLHPVSTRRRSHRGWYY